MESILARALEYTLKYWLKSFSRDQFKLQGRTAQLSNLDINGDALHASVGLPPALHVTKAKVGKLEITLPSVSNVQIEPIIVRIDRLDLILEENSDACDSASTSCSQASSNNARGGGYGFADKIADGMTLEVGTVNLMIETRGGARTQGGATWISPIASITMRNLLLYTTNENWQVVNLKEAREFSNKKKFIYVFKKLEWESLSVDILPHPDMFSDAYMMMSPENGGNERDNDGAKRVFFGGERFLEGISGYAHITVQRTEYNNPLGLEVQLHVTEAICPSLSEPGLRALLRFMTGFYVCLNRGDIGSQVPSLTDAAGRSLVSVIVDHIFVCIKDSGFQLELLMQSLYFSRASISDGENTKNLSRIMIGGLFLRDAFSHPPCTLIQPSIKPNAEDQPRVPEFVENFCPPIYPLGDVDNPYSSAVPLICIHSLQANPPLAPPSFASETVIDCLPLTITLQEESCLRIASFLSDGIVIGPGSVLPDSSINSVFFTLREFDLIVPLNDRKALDLVFDRTFSGARLHVESLVFSQSPSQKCELLNLERDPACFALWRGQPVDASQKKWKTQVSHLSISLETSPGKSSGLWTCVDLEKASFEAAMVTPDGSPLSDMPPPGGIVRIGMACQKYISNASVDQLFFILDLYTYFGKVSDRILKISKSSKQKRSKSEPSLEKLLEKVPSDTAVSLSVSDLQLKFLDSPSSSSPIECQGMPLVFFSGDDLFVKVSHRKLGGAFAMSTNLHWGSIRVDCVDADQNIIGYPSMRSVFWINNNPKKGFLGSSPFLEVRAVHVMPYNVKDSECHSLNLLAKVAGVRLGGGMSYTEALLHRFGVIGPDGGPGDGLNRGLERLSSGPLAKLLRASPLEDSSQRRVETPKDEQSTGFLELGRPDDVDISLEMKDWLFALEGLKEGKEEPLTFKYEGVKREERHWHGTFRSVKVNAKSSSKTAGKSCGSNRYPVESLIVSMEGLKALKPHSSSLPADSFDPFNLGTTSGGMNLEVNIAMSKEEQEEMNQWMVESLTFSVKEPVEVVVTRDEVEHLAALCSEEVDSVGRITAGILRLLKLDESVGRATLDQLSNLGKESVDKIFSPERLSRSQTLKTTAFTPESTVFSLEAILSDSQAKCSTLVAELAAPEFPPHILQEIKQLNQNLENMQLLLTRLKKSTQL